MLEWLFDLDRHKDRFKDLGRVREIREKQNEGFERERYVMIGSCEKKTAVIGF